MSEARKLAVKNRVEKMRGSGSGVRCRSFVDWPVYPRLARTMPSATLTRNRCGGG
jgi:hypothetical protein